LYDRAIDVVVYLVNEMRNNKSFAEIDLRVLEESGFTQTEIGSACSWLSEKLVRDDGVQLSAHPPTDRSYRILHDVERIVLKPETQGYLLQLSELGILNERMLEGVIDRAMMSGYSTIGIQEIKAIVSALIFERDEVRKVDKWYFFPWNDTIH
jgi:uncharacterized protein Smg (DUF494 family)